MSIQKYPVQAWLPDMVTTIHDDLMRRKWGYGIAPRAALIHEPPMVGKGFDCMAYDATAKSVARLFLVDAEVASVALAEGRASVNVSFRGNDLHWAVRLVKPVVEPCSRIVTGYESAATEERPHWTSRAETIPPSWWATWNIDPGGNWDVGREDGRCAIVPRAGRFDLVYGLCGSELAGSVTLSPDEVDAIEAWCAAPDRPFPSIESLDERYVPRLDEQGTAALVRSFRGSLHLLSF